MKKTNLVIFCLFLLNSLDVVYLFSLKIGLLSELVYLLLVPFIIFILYSNFGRYSYKNLVGFLFFILYFCFQLINGFFNSYSPEYSVITFLSFALTIYLFQMFSKIRLDELYAIILGIYIYTVVTYIGMDILYPTSKFQLKLC